MAEPLSVATSATKSFLKRALEQPFLTGKTALLFGITAVAVPTLIRGLVEGSVTGSEFLPYFPFVLLSALVLGCTHAAAVALTSAAVADFIFMEPYFALAAGPSDLFGIGVFLLSSALIIGVIRALRGCVENVVSLEVPDFSQGIIFSCEQEQAWASWTSARPRVHLGPQDAVAYMMEDFLAQVELGKRLNSRGDRTDS